MGGRLKEVILFAGGGQVQIEKIRAKK